MRLDKKKIMSLISDKDVEKICSKLGCPDCKQFSYGIGFSTALCHQGDSPYKLIYYSDTRKFHCFTCGDSYDLIELVMRAHRSKGKILTWYKALYWIAETTGHLIKEESSNNDTDLINDFEWMNPLKAIKKRNAREVPVQKPINENILEMFYYGTEPIHDWIEEGISPEALGRFEIGFWGLTNQITIPHRNWQDESLIGIRGRWTDERAEILGKYMPLQVEGNVLKHSLGSTLYGLWVSKNKILSCHKVLIVEAEKSCLLAYTYFGEESYCVATCGSSITQTQQKILLKEMQVEEIIYAPDRDYEESESYVASIWWAKQVKKVAFFVPFCEVYIVADKGKRLDYKDSPLDKGLDVFLELYDEKIPVTMEEVKQAKEGR